MDGYTPITFVKITSVDELFENPESHDTIMGHKVEYCSGNKVFPKRKGYSATISFAFSGEAEISMKKMMKEMGFLLPQSYSLVQRNMVTKDLKRVFKDINAQFV